jgi:uncharacterized lipoprotein YddW (UPF0748 family)
MVLAPVAAGAREELRGVYMELTTNQNFGALPLVPDGDWRCLCRELKSLGVNSIFPNVVSPAHAVYPSYVVGKPEGPTDLYSVVLALIGKWEGPPDLLKTIVSAAHAEGLEVHAWTIEWYNAPPNIEPDRLVHDAAGKTTNTLCPSVVENRDLMRRMIMELVTYYEIDGIQYDTMRFPEGGPYCYCRHCRERFEKFRGSPVVNWPTDVLTGGRWEKEYLEYLYSALNSFVRDMYSRIKKVKPRMVVSAAVWCLETGSKVVSVRQDWGTWVREGWLDFVVPMNYGNNWILQHYGDFARNEARQVAGRIPLVFGLGAFMDSATGVENAVKLDRELNGAGDIIYTLTERTFKVHLPALKRTVWSEPVTVPRFGRP